MENPAVTLIFDLLKCYHFVKKHTCWQEYFCGFYLAVAFSILTRSRSICWSPLEVLVSVAFREYCWM